MTNLLFNLLDAKLENMKMQFFFERSPSCDASRNNEIHFVNPISAYSNDSTPFELENRSANVRVTLSHTMMSFSVTENSSKSKRKSIP